MTLYALVGGESEHHVGGGVECATALRAIKGTYRHGALREPRKIHGDVEIRRPEIVGLRSADERKGARRGHQYRNAAYCDCSERFCHEISIQIAIYWDELVSPTDSNLFFGAL